MVTLSQVRSCFNKIFDRRKHACLILSALLCFFQGSSFLSSIMTESTFPDSQVTSKIQKNQIHDNTRLCSQQEITQGEWLPVTYDQLPYLPIKKSSKQCYTELVQPWHTYEWQPSAATKTTTTIDDDGLCEFSKWDQDLFCQLAHNRTISMVGDSLMLEQFSSLIHMLGIRDFQEAFVYNTSGYFEYTVCPHNTTRIFFEWNNWLRKVFKRGLSVVEPDILILNKGAWWTNNPAHRHRVMGVFPQLKEWQTRCQQQERQCHLIWRTTVPGHPLCQTMTHPSTNISQMEALIADQSLYPKQNLKFNWRQFQSQNKMTIDLFRAEAANNTKVLFPPLDIMDAYPILVLRPDDHIGFHNPPHKRGDRRSGFDCMHNCQPGKTLVYNQLLLHQMKEWQREEK